jgi:lipopolysaccharide biosynthesis glycosyltransferase
MIENNQPIIEIAIASDSNYLIPTTVVMKSLFENNTKNQITVNLLYLVSMTKEEDLTFWEQYTKSHNQQFRKIPVIDEQIAVYPELRHSKSTYLRLLLPELLPECVSKVLYLDADTIVSGDISELYKTDISDNYAAGAKEVINCYAKTIPHFQSHIDNLGIASNHFYFSAGVLLMNIKKMKADKVVSKYFQFAIEHPELIIWSDQDILNGVLSSSVKYIHPKYNMNYNVEPDILEATWSKKEVSEAKNNPVIIHYIGPIKPWHYLTYHPRNGLWWKYLKMTPFKDFKPTGKSSKLILRKYYLKMARMLDRNISLSKKRKIGKLIPAVFKNKVKKGIGK